MKYFGKYLLLDYKGETVIFLAIDRDREWAMVRRLNEPPFCVRVSELKEIPDDRDNY